tara:strand:+ start:1680 stop:1847 length:168 start_codon:yes stop_codon:yes gene_type:complete
MLYFRVACFSLVEINELKLDIACLAKVSMKFVGKLMTAKIDLKAEVHLYEKWNNR